METTWRFRAILLVVLAIPAVGGWHCIKHYQIMNNPTRSTVSELPSIVNSELQQVELFGFTVPDGDVVVSGQYEYVCVESSSELDTSELGAVVLQRRTGLENSISDEVSSGVVSGLVSSRQVFTKEDAIEFGLAVPEFAKDRILVVELDRDYRGSLAGLTFGFSIYGLIALAFAYTKMDESSFSKRHRKSHTQAQVALQLLIARQDSHHH